MQRRYWIIRKKFK